MIPAKWNAAVVWLNHTHDTFLPRTAAKLSVSSQPPTVWVADWVAESLSQMHQLQVLQTVPGDPQPLHQAVLTVAHGSQRRICYFGLETLSSLLTFTLLHKVRVRFISVWHHFYPEMICVTVVYVGITQPWPATNTEGQCFRKMWNTFQINQ